MMSSMTNGERLIELVVICSDEEQLLLLIMLCSDTLLLEAADLPLIFENASIFCLCLLSLKSVSVLLFY